MVVFSAEWFNKHQRVLLWLLNTPVIGWWFRWVLSIRSYDIGHRRPITRLLPHAYEVTNADGSITADFRTHHKYAKRLYFAFKPFWYLLHGWDWAIANPFVPAWNAGFDTLTAYPEALGGSTTADAYIMRGTINFGGTGGLDESFASIRTGAGTDQSSGDGTIAIWINASTTTDQYKGLSRGIATFDTSTIGIGTITSAVVSLWGIQDSPRSSGLGTSVSLDCVSAAPASNNTFVANDYGTFGTTVFATIDYSTLAPTGFSIPGSYNDWTLNSDGLANINKTNVSRFGWRWSWDTSGTFGGTWSSGGVLQFNPASADAAGTSQDPKLVVTYFGVSASPSISPSASKSPSASFSPSASVSASISPSASSNQFLYPNADIATGGWSPTSGANLYQMLDETLVPDDSSTYIYSPISDGTCVVELREGSTLIATRTIARPSTVDQWQTFVYELTTGEKNAVSDWTNLAFWFTVNGSDVAKVKLQSGSVPGTLADPVIMYVRMRIKPTAP